MRLLLKYPTRGRPAQFLTTLKGWITAAANPAKLAVLVSYDSDDATMTPDVIAAAEKLHPAVVCVKGESKTKIEAINADINDLDVPWEVILIISDDMFCRRKGWDSMIEKYMNMYFPDGDGSLWFYDGSQKKINTIPCLGRKYYEGA